ncbi:MAG: S9 family peptidase, partial [Bacteroidales bacterium]|nr:S9 family peptidase [Bacteroidales bacterium]
MRTSLKIMAALFVILLISVHVNAQGRGIKWSNDGNSYYRVEKNEIVQYTLPVNEANIIVSKQQLTPEGSDSPLKISFYTFSQDQQMVLLFTNTKKVWRLNSRGDYWILDLKSNKLKQLGESLPTSSLMFAKFSPDGKSVAYVSGNNIYTEEISTSKINAVTTDGSTTLINGTFDWVYEEEFTCRDGFRWSPDSKSIAFWQIDASTTKKFYLINNTDSIYSQLVPIEYPKVGEKPSTCRLGVATISDNKITWMNIPGEPDQHYIVRMEFIPASNNLLIQQLNRKQNHSKLFISEIENGNSRLIQEETDEAWVDIYQSGNPYTIDFTNNFIWLNESNSILWASEKDGWRHLYQVSLEGKPEKLITKGEYDFIDLKFTDQKAGFVYFMASPENATQKYLYRTKLNGKGSLELISPSVLKGNHDYSISFNGNYASHTFSNNFTKPSREFITLSDHKPLVEKDGIISRLDTLQESPTT